MMIRRNMKVEVTLTPSELALEFSMMDEAKQAEFFSALAHTVSVRGRPFCLQLQAITDCPVLTDDARSLMQEIGKYSGKY